jgi:hypothetical protein
VGGVDARSQTVKTRRTTSPASAPNTAAVVDVEFKGVASGLGVRVVDVWLTAVAHAVENRDVRNRRDLGTKTACLTAAAGRVVSPDVFASRMAAAADVGLWAAIKSHKAKPANASPTAAVRAVENRNAQRRRDLGTPSV